MKTLSWIQAPSALLLLFASVTPAIRLAAQVAPVPALATTESKGGTPDQNKASDKATDITNTLDNQYEDQLKKLGFAAGIGSVFMVGDREVENASVDSNGILRVDFKSRARLGAILETHFLFTNRVDGANALAGPNVRKTRIRQLVLDQTSTVFSDAAFGVMAGAEIGDNALRSLGVGLIGSFRRFDLDGSSGKLTQKVAFNVGVLCLVEQNVKMLAKGFYDGKPLPTGATDIRFRRDYRMGVALVFSIGY